MIDYTQMTNRDFIEKYKNEDQIIKSYYQVKDRLGRKINIEGIVNPLKIDNRQLMSPTDDQTTTPHCAGFSACTLIESILWKKTGKLRQLDAHQVYSLAKQLDGDVDEEGTYLEASLKSVIELCKNDSELGFMKNAKINQFFNDGTLNTVEMTKHLIHQNDFLQVGFAIDDGWYDCTNGRYVLKKGTVPYGGHAVNLCYYDQDYVGILNQWGKDWGAKGYCLMPWDLFLKEFMYGAYVSFE